MSDSTDVASVLEELLDLLYRFVAFRDEHQAHAFALFIAASYAVGALEVGPYVRITSPEPGCGKSTLGSFASYCMYGRPRVLAKATPAAIRRLLAETPDSSLILDELDQVDPRSEYGQELYGTINSGYSRLTAHTVRADVKSRGGVVEETTFGFKVLIGIDGATKALPETTLSRCIEIRLQRALAGEVLEVWEPTGPQVAMVTEVADRFVGVMERLEWSWKPPEALADGRTVSLAVDSVQQLTNRERQLWRPLFAVAEYAGADWLTRAIVAHDVLAGSVEPPAAIVRDLTTVLELLAGATYPTTDGEAVTAETLRAALVGLSDSTWTAGDRRSELTTRRLSRLLEPYGLSTRQRAVLGDGKTKHRGYLVSELEALSERYSPINTGDSGRSGRTQTPQGLQPDFATGEQGHSPTTKTGGNVDTPRVLPYLPQDPAYMGPDSDIEALLDPFRHSPNGGTE